MSTETVGMLTGTQSLLTGSSTRLYTAHYYNVRGELIQSNSQNLIVTSSANPKSPTVLGMGYDFKGRLIKSVLSAPGIIVQKKFTYDLYDRITKIQHKIDNAGDFTTIASYVFDDIGRMKTKILGNMKHSVYYEYNIRNWVTGINRQYLIAPNSNSLFFGMQLFYEQGYDKTYLNGRIAGIQWRNKGTNSELRSYGYEYDTDQRLKNADYYQLVGSAWQKNIKDFTTSNLTYDHNGNILSMNHRGYSNTDVLDDLTYSYASGTNKLTEVVEGSSSQSKNPAVHDNLGDFRDDAAGTDYTYDANGNLISDGNRGVTMNNTWFTINKPITVTKSEDDYVNYVYDAMGNMLQKRSTTKVAGVSQTKITNYILDVVYEGNTPNLVMHEEGRIRKVANTSGPGTRYQYDYFLKDHIGNIRSVITETQTFYFGVNDYDANPGSLQFPLNPGPIKPLPFDPVLCTCPPYVCVDCLPKPKKPEPCAECITDWPENNLNPILILVKDPGNKDGFGEVDLFNYFQNEEQEYEEAEPVDLTPILPRAISNGVMYKTSVDDRIYVGIDASYMNTLDPAVNFPLEEYIQTMLGADLTSEGLPASIISDLVSDSIRWDSLVPAPSGYGPDQNNTFLNYILFDENMNIQVEVTSEISKANIETRLGMSSAYITIPLNGYLYVFTSNKPFISTAQTFLKVVSWQPSVVEEFHYYPFGLTFDVNTGLTSQTSNILYNSQSKEQKEFKDGSGIAHGLEWYDFMARSYDPQIGRWMQPDPLMQHASPYLAMGNNPVSFTDPTGLEDGGPRSSCVPYPDSEGSNGSGAQYTEYGGPGWKEGYTSYMDYAIAQGKSGGAGGGAPFPITDHEIRNWNTTYRPDPTGFSGGDAFKWDVQSASFKNTQLFFGTTGAQAQIAESAAQLGKHDAARGGLAGKSYSAVKAEVQTMNRIGKVMKVGGVVTGVFSVGLSGISFMQTGSLSASDGLNVLGLGIAIAALTLTGPVIVTAAILVGATQIVAGEYLDNKKVQVFDPEK
ncbi:MAG: RHS repeat-associated core domain-containing protein [Bacteroidota bacterium]